MYEENLNIIIYEKALLSVMYVYTYVYVLLNLIIDCYHTLFHSP